MAIIFTFTNHPTMITEQDKKVEKAHEDPLSREMIERLFNKQRGDMTKKCFNICGVEQVAKDCVQEAFLMLLLHPPFSNFGTMATYAYVIAKHAALGHLRKMNVRARHQDVVIDLLTKGAGQQTGGLFNYHPLDGKLTEGFKQLREDSRTAVVGFMYSIPYDKLAKIYGHTSMTMHHRVKEALSQLKDYLLGKEHTVGSSKMATSQRDSKTDSIYRLKKAGWSVQDIAEHLGLSPKKIAGRYCQRLKTMKKYPNSFKDLL